MDSIREGETVKKVCGEPEKGFERDCASSWVRKGWTRLNKMRGGVLNG